MFQRDMAEFLGISTRAYQMYENGTNGPGVENLIKLADYFNVSIDYLVGRSDDPTVKRIAVCKAEHGSIQLPEEEDK